MLKTVRNTFIAVILLLALIGGGAAAYVYLAGGSSQETEEILPPPKDELALPKPRKPNPKAPLGASVVSLRTPVKAGDNTSMMVRTAAGAKCSIDMKYGDIVSKDSGLAAKKADDYGNITWSWTVDPAAPAGTWPAKVTCKNLKHSAFVQGNLKVVR